MVTFEPSVGDSYDDAFDYLMRRFANAATRDGLHGFDEDAVRSAHEEAMAAVLGLVRKKAKKKGLWTKWFG